MASIGKSQLKIKRITNSENMQSNKRLIDLLRRFSRGSVLTDITGILPKLWIYVDLFE
jgi:hypothetical protein